MSGKLETALLQRWQQLLHPFCTDSTAIQASFARLVAAYSRPDRHYHTLIHIQQVLTTIATLRDHTRSPLAVELAAWLHDVVYDPRSADNEAQSAIYAERMLGELGIPAATIASVTRLILATQHHTVDPNDRDGQVLLDADLAILGAAPARYQHYAQAIRREYAWVSEAEYRAGRSRVLANFLQRDRLYFTDRLFRQAEAQARSNLRAELAQLTGIAF